MGDNSGFKVWYAVSFALQLGFIVVVPIGGFMFLGLLGDNFFGTAPLFLFVGTVVGIAITVYEVYHMITTIIQGDD